MYCHPVAADDWPAEPEIVERVALRSAPGAAPRSTWSPTGPGDRSQIVFTRGRGREMVFWQSPRTRKQARPDVRLPTARASGVGELEIVVDAHERYAYGSPTSRSAPHAAWRCGDYAVSVDGKVVAAVERSRCRSRLQPDQRAGCGSPG